MFKQSLPHNLFISWLPPVCSVVLWWRSGVVWWWSSGIQGSGEALLQCLILLTNTNSVIIILTCFPSRTHLYSSLLHCTVLDIIIINIILYSETSWPGVVWYSMWSWKHHHHHHHHHYHCAGYKGDHTGTEWGVQEAPPLYSLLCQDRVQRGRRVQSPWILNTLSGCIDRLITLQRLNGFCNKLI